MEKNDAIYLKDYTPPNHLIDHVDLLCDIGADHCLVTSRMKIRKNPKTGGAQVPLVFDKGDCEIVSVFADGMLLLPAEYEADGEYFRLSATPEQFELKITTRLTPSENTSLEGLYQSGDIICTQCESQGFRKITPFPDRPDIMATYSCTIIADKTDYPVLLSNGNRIKSGDLPDHRHFARWEDPFKKPCYLFALVAGDLAHIRDFFVTRSGRRVELRIYSEKRTIHQCEHAMTCLKQAMAWDEQRFGLEYDLDLYQIVAIHDFNAGAMENKGLNIFNSKFVLADSGTATDDDFMNVQAVIGHEYFHNWTGNRITLRDWFQLSLKEGLTVFRDQEFSSDLNSRGVERITNVRNLRAFQFPEDAGPMAHPVRPESYIKMDNFYTMTVYEKGSELIRMMHRLLGEADFMKGMALYVERFDGMAVTIEDFIEAMETAGDRDLTQFRLWYAQSGTPTVTVTRDYDRQSKKLSIRFDQHTPPDHNQSEKKPLHIPVGFGLLDADGRDITPPGKDLIELTGETDVVVLDEVPENSLPSVFRQFSAPVKVKTDWTVSELAFLMAHDRDEVSRWDCAQTLFFKEIRRMVGEIENKKTPEVSENLIRAFAEALEEDQTDRAFKAKLLTLPSEIEIRDEFNPVPVEAVHQAGNVLEKTLAKRLKSLFVHVMETCSQSDPLSLSHRAMADRSLKNLCLSYLGALNEKETSDLVFDHFVSARNMTDESAALKILCNLDIDIKQRAVQAFHDKWRHDKLVLDKWFAIQAGSSLPDTLDRIKILVRHPDFSMRNPNKVRSLLHLFALQNHFQFHRADGAGYAFIADRIMDLDPVNHQVAARLAACFNHWKKYDEQRKTMMKKELERILGVRTLSKNVYEIVSRALA